MRIRLIASFLLLVLVTIGVFIVVTVRQNTQELNNFVARRGLTGSEQVVSVLEGYFRDNGTWEGVGDLLLKAPQVPRWGMWAPPLSEDQTRELQPGKNREQVLNAPSSRMDLLLADGDGNLVAKSGMSPYRLGKHLTRVELQRSIPLKVNGKTVGYLLSGSGEVITAATQISLLSRLNRAAVLAVLIGGSAALILAMVLSYSLVRPVRALQLAASRLATGDLSQRVRVRGQDELADLGRTFNHMAESLQDAEESRRSMTADIAHELRNPLAVQRAHLEAIEDGVYPLTSDSLNIIEEQNRLLSRLVEDLRTLAMVDAGKLEMQRTQVDFTSLVRQVAARFQVQAADKKINLHLTLEECPPLTVDPQRIEQILHNLFSNALRFTPQEGEIHCQLWVDRPLPDAGPVVEKTPPYSKAKTCNLQIRDSGPGIPAGSLPHIFDRFYRADRSRSRSDGGTGLGLSIARKLAQVLGGDLTASNHPQGGAVFILSLPVEVDP